MRILHLANWNSTNIGNGALIFGTQRVLAEDFSADIEFVPEAWDDYTFKRKNFNRDFVARVNEYEALLVNGAVTMNAFRKSMQETGMRFNLPLPLWNEIQVPIIFYGISYRCWPFQSYENLEALKKTILYAVGHPRIFFGVRNDGTKEWIRNRLGIDSPSIVEVPDPALFVPFDADENYHELSSERKNILVAFNGEDALYRYATSVQRVLWPWLEPILGDRILTKIFGLTGGYIHNRKNIAKKIAHTLERVSERHDVQIIVVPHYLDDFDMIDDFINAVQERIAHQRVVSANLLSVPHTSYVYGRYHAADAAISMRVHSMSPCIGMSTPMVPVTSQGRMRVFLKKAGLEDLGVDMHDKDFENVLTEKLLLLLENPSEYKKKTAESSRRMREVAREINSALFKLLSK